MSALILLYAGSVSLIKLGFSVHYFRITVADALLVISAVWCALHWLRSRSAVAFRFSACWPCAVSIFFLCLVPGAFLAGFSSEVLLELCAYVNAALVSWVFWYVLRLYPGLHSRVNFSIFVLLGVSAIPALISFFVNMRAPWLRFFYNDAEKYQFLCVSPNQLAAFVLITLSLLLVDRRLNLLLRFVMLFVGGLMIFMSGSRTGGVLYLLIFIYAVIAAICSSVRRAKGGRALLFITISALLMPLVFIPFVSKRFWNTGRSISGFQYVLKGHVGDEYRQAQSRHSLQVFKQSSFRGIGWGEYFKVSPDGHEIHNSYLVLLVEGGFPAVLGFLLLVVFLVTLVGRSGAPFSVKLDGYVALAVIALLMLNHHVLRERWLWLFLAQLQVYFAAGSFGGQRQCAA